VSGDVENLGALAIATAKRLRRANKRKTGCRLTPQMVQFLAISILEEWIEHADGINFRMPND